MLPLDGAECELPSLGLLAVVLLTDPDDASEPPPADAANLAAARPAKPSEPPEPVDCDLPPEKVLPLSCRDVEPRLPLPCADEFRCESLSLPSDPEPSEHPDHALCGALVVDVVAREGALWLDPLHPPDPPLLAEEPGVDVEPGLDAEPGPDHDPPEPDADGPYPDPEPYELLVGPGDDNPLDGADGPDRQLLVSRYRLPEPSEHADVNDPALVPLLVVHQPHFVSLDAAFSSGSPSRRRCFLRAISSGSSRQNMSSKTWYGYRGISARSVGDFFASFFSQMKCHPTWSLPALSLYGPKSWFQPMARPSGSKRGTTSLV